MLIRWTYKLESRKDKTHEVNRAVQGLDNELRNEAGAAQPVQALEKQ